MFIPAWGLILLVGIPFILGMLTIMWVTRLVERTVHDAINPNK